MSNQTTAATDEPYLPAVLAESTEPGPVEWLLTKPFHRVRAIWQSAE